MKERKRFAERDNRGFTLVEVLVALAVLAIVSMPLLSYFTDGLKLNALSANKQKANLAAQSIMEDFKSKTMAEIAQEYRGFSGDSGQYKDDTYSLKYAATEEFVPNQPDPTSTLTPVEPYYFQYCDYMVGEAAYDVRVKVSEGIYQWKHIVSGTAINDWNTFQNYDLSEVEATNNAVIQEGVSDRESAVMALLKAYPDFNGTIEESRRASVEENMIRQMELTVDKTGDTIKVTLWNVYTCPDIREIDTAEKRVLRFERTYSELDSIYLFFYPAASTNHNLGVYKDKIKVNLTGEYNGRNIFDVCNVYMVSATAPETYWLMEEGDQLCYADNTLLNPLRNNVTVTNLTKKVDPVGAAGPRFNAEYYDLVGGHKQRLLNIEVSVYRNGHAGESKYLLFTLNSAEDDE